jgi:lysophospholipase L1-like esterase
VAQGTTSITTNLQTILDRITAADGKLPKSAGMSYYDPFLANWLSGTQGQLVAAASVTLLVTINAIETLEYGEHGFKTADVQAAFHTGDFGHKRFVLGYGVLPANVADICQFTYMCSQQNIHPTAQGYRIIANAFAAKIG